MRRDKSQAIYWDWYGVREAGKAAAFCRLVWIMKAAPGARHPQHRADGRPRDAAHQQPAHGHWLHHGVVTEANLRAQNRRRQCAESRRAAAARPALENSGQRSLILAA